MESERHVACAEALLPLDFLRWQKHREQFVLAAVVKVVSMTSTYVAMQFAEVQQHFDALIVDEASHLLELETGLLFVLLGSNGCQTIVLLGNPDEHPVVVSNRVHPENGARQVALLSTQCELFPPPSEQFPHFCYFDLFLLFTMFCLVMFFQPKKTNLPFFIKTVGNGLNKNEESDKPKVRDSREIFNVVVTQEFLGSYY